MKFAGLSIILALAVVMVFAISGRADSISDQPLEQASVAKGADRISPERKYPIEAPPASEVLPRLRKLTESRPPVQEKKNEETPQVKMLRLLTGQGGANVGVSEPQCFRSVPTQGEFLDMVRNSPADANQIMQKCYVETRNMSPLPQLPVGTRQLPEDTRQRPVQSFGNTYSAPVAPQGSRTRLGINLKTHRIEPYYGLNQQFGNTHLGIRLGRGKHKLQQYYRIGPSDR
jgi:hypothetical protein